MAVSKSWYVSGIERRFRSEVCRRLSCKGLSVYCNQGPKILWKFLLLNILRLHPALRVVSPGSLETYPIVRFFTRDTLSFSGNVTLTLLGSKFTTFHQIKSSILASTEWILEQFSRHRCGPHLFKTDPVGFHERRCNFPSSWWADVTPAWCDSGLARRHWK